MCESEGIGSRATVLTHEVVTWTEKEMMTMKIRNKTQITMITAQLLR